MKEEGRRQILLAEYNVLAAEIAGRSSAQHRVQNLSITASAAVFTLAISQDIDLVLFVVPALVCSMSAIWIDHARNISNIGTYISSELWPMLRTIDGEDLPSHEDWVRIHDSRPKHVALLTVPTSLTFCVPALVAIAILAPSLTGSFAIALLWIFDLLATALTIVYWFAFTRNSNLATYTG